MIESQSFALWTLAAVFEFLRDSNCVPEDPMFGHLVSSMTMAINAQAKASFSAVAFLQHKHCETYVSHLPVSTHSSVKHALLSTLTSSSELFHEEVIRSSLTQVKDDSQFSLLRNLSSLKGEKQSASPASTSGQRRRGSSAFSSSSCPCLFSRRSRGSECAASSSPGRKCKVSFKGIRRSPTPKKNFPK